MIWQRVQRDPSLQSLWSWILLTALTTSALVGGLAFQVAVDPAPGDSTVRLLLVLWLAVTVYLLLGKVRTRCARIDLALPIPSRQLWLSHAVAVFVSSALVLAASIGVLALHRAVLGPRLGAMGLEIDLVALALPAVAGVLLMVILQQCFRPGLWQVQGTRYWAFVFSSLVAVIALIIVLSSSTWLATLVPLLLAIAIGVRTYRTLPPALSWVPLEPVTRLASWAIAITLGGAAYLLALRQFERAEIPARSINCALVDWGQDTD